MLKSHLAATKSPPYFERVNGAPKSTHRPVGLTVPNGEPIFGYEAFTAWQGEHVAAKHGFMRYDDEVARQRRLLAETVLAQLVLDDPSSVWPAVNAVSSGIASYWAKKQATLTAEQLGKMVQDAEKYLYGKTSFGRLPQLEPTAPSAPTGGATAVVVSPPTTIYTPVTSQPSSALDQQANQFKHTVGTWLLPFSAKQPYLPNILNVHDHFLRVFKSLGPSDANPTQSTTWDASPEQQRMSATLKTVRPGWYDDKSTRGRVAVADYVSESKIRIAARSTPHPPGPGMTSQGISFPGGVPSAPTPTMMPGLLTGDFTIPCVAPMERCGLDLLNLPESRMRGRDMNLPNAATMEPKFRQILADHNLPFSASASGTTSTLLTSAMTFGNLGGMEAKKQYLLACVAYLVGGGMHTCHEVFVTGKLLGVPYRAGQYQPTLPTSFTATLAYQTWEAEFWDVARPY